MSLGRTSHGRSLGSKPIRLASLNVPKGNAKSAVTARTSAVTISQSAETRDSKEAQYGSGGFQLPRIWPPPYPHKTSLNWPLLSEIPAKTRTKLGHDAGVVRPMQSRCNCRHKIQEPHMCVTTENHSSQNCGEPHILGNKIPQIVAAQILPKDHA